MSAEMVSRLIRTWAPAGAAFVALAASAADAFAADVTVKRKGAKVTVVCSDANDWLRIDSVAEGEIRIASDDGGLTTVGGAAEQSIAVGPKDTVVVQFAGGTNQLTVTGVLPAFKALSVVGDWGNDEVVVNQASFAAAFSFAGSNSQNSVTFRKSSVGGRVTIRGGLDVDSVTASETTFAGPVAADLRVSSSGGFTLDGNTFRAAAVLRGGVGGGTTLVRNCTFEKSLRLDAGSGNDTLSVAGDSFLGAATLLGGRGEDTIVCSAGTEFRAPGRVDGGPDGDVVTLDGANIAAGASLRVTGASGDDDVTLRAGTYSGDVTVSLGAGNDSVTADAGTPPTLGGAVVIDGGSGADALSGGALLVPPAGKRRIVKGVEIQP